MSKVYVQKFQTVPFGSDFCFICNCSLTYLPGWQTVQILFAGMRLFRFLADFISDFLVSKYVLQKDIFGKGDSGFQIFYLEFRLFHQSSSLMPAYAI